MFYAGRVAQWIEHLPSKQMVGSSILSSVKIKIFMTDYRILKNYDILTGGHLWKY